MFLRFQQVSRLENHRLGLAYDVEIEHAGACRCIARFDSCNLSFYHLRELFEERVSQMEGLVYLGVIVILEHVYYHAVDD